MKSSLAALLIVVFHAAMAKVDFCEENQFPDSKTSPSLQFTKEQSDWEYAVDTKFKSLHCCAKGYLSIQWFKDGRPYPWPGVVSSFIIYPESENQTIYTKALSSSDAGNYSCRIHNSTQNIIHNTELKVFDSSGYMETPLATYKPPLISTAIIGEDNRIFCEAFVGHIDLPDASTEVSWTKKGANLIENPRITVERVQRENGQIVGAYLKISKVEWSDLGSYICTISNTGDQKIIMETEVKAFTAEFEQLCLQNHKALIILLFMFPLLCFLVFYLYCFFLKNNHTWTEVWVKVSEIAPFNKKNRHKSGIVLIYEQNDGIFMENVLVPLIKEQTGFFCFPQKINENGEVSEETKELCRKVQKTIIALSKNLVKEWNREGINETLEKLIIKDSTYLVVLLEPLPETTEDQIPYFKKLHNKFNLLPWDESFITGSLPFWTQESSEPCLLRMEHRNSQSLLEVFLKRNKPSTEVHV